MKKTIALIANGLLDHDEALLSQLRSFPHLIAVDGGLNHCLKYGLKPELVIGDFDSATPAALAHFHDVPKVEFARDKDNTDLEIALDHIDKYKAEKIIVFGGLGGRVDHTLSNINLLSLYPGKLFLESAQETLFVINRSATLACHAGQTLSLIPLNGPVRGITTRGLKWELNKGALDKHFLGISNVALGATAYIEATHGDLLCCLLKAFQ